MSEEKTVNDIEQLISEFKQSGLRELHARVGEFEIYLSMDSHAPGLGGAIQNHVVHAAAVDAPASAPATSPASVHAPAKAATAKSVEVAAGATVIKAPYLGTFYRAPKPGSPPYVEVGSVVGAESELCLVEVMKLFTAVRAGMSGKIVQIFAQDGELVSEGQPLFSVLPG